jgi:hypothetical protein
MNIAKPKFKLCVELCYYMSCFNDKQKQESYDKIKEIATQNSYIIDDTSSKAVWKFAYKLKVDEPVLEN